ncbi:DUF2407 C-terminal domain-containing protein [Entophlyctis helioformis]|nr:DUF2407 C-terminal domain-containing protein [Entophlyctis helioformis]
MSQDEVQNLRSQFHALRGRDADGKQLVCQQGLASLPAGRLTDPSFHGAAERTDQARNAEEEWMDNPGNVPSTNQGVAPSVTSISASSGCYPLQSPCSHSRADGLAYEPADDGTHLDMLVGLLVGFFMGILVLFWVKEANMYNRRQQLGMHASCTDQLEPDLYADCVRPVHRLLGIVTGLVINLAFGMLRM